MKTVVDKKRREVHYEVGYLVLLKLHPYCQKFLSRCWNEKLAPRYFGLYEVLQRVGEVAYKLKLPDSTMIDPVFHMS